MAKKRGKVLEVSSTAEMAGDKANPRKISDRSAAGLSKSLSTFGDLAGIVFNRRTKELVCGHQRLAEIRKQWGDREIVLVDAARDLWGIPIDDNHFFAVRMVDWTPAKQRAANVAANNQAIAGEFTEGLQAYLLELKPAMQAELGQDIMNELLLAGLIESEADGDASSIPIVETYQVLVECKNEADQKQIYEQLKKQGLMCRVITM